MNEKVNGLKKWHLLMMMIGFVVINVGSGLSSYYSSIGSVRAEINDVRLKLSSSETEAERRFAKSSDLKALMDKLTTISDDVSEIKGYLRQRRGPRPR